MAEVAMEAQRALNNSVLGLARWTPREPKAPMGAVAAVIPSNGSPGQPENFACVEAEKDGE